MSELVVNEAFIADHIGKSVNIIKSGDLLDHNAACPDGRNTLNGWFHFGGGSARRLLYFATVEDVLGEQYQTDEIGFLNAELTHRRPNIHIHFDDHFTHQLAGVVIKDNAFQAVAEMKDEHDYNAVEKLIHSARELDFRARRRLADVFVEIGDVGCGHWALMIKNPGDYGLRRELVHDVYKTSLMLAWSHTATQEMPVLHGEHTELAIAQIFSEDDAHLPLVTPNVDGVEVFASTPQAVRLANRLSARRIREVFGSNVNGNYVSRLDELTAEHQNVTLRKLGAAKGKPIYNVYVNPLNNNVRAEFVGING